MQLSRSIVPGGQPRGDGPHTRGFDKQRAAWLLPVLLLLAALRPAGTLAQSAATALSPEEAVISLLPYEVTAGNLPAAYSPNPPDAVTPVAQAANATNPQSRLATLTGEGFVVGFDQDLAPGASSPLDDAALLVYLMAGPAAAKTYTTDATQQPQATASSRVDPVASGVTAGDSSITWHLAQTLSQGNSQGGYEVRWQRGQLVLTVITLATFGQEKIDDARSLVTAIDKKVVAAGQPALSAPTSTPAASESDRLTAGLKLESLLLRGSNVPSGFQQVSVSLEHPAEAVLQNGNPQRALATFDQRYRRVMGIEQLFRTAGTTGSGTRQIVGLFINQDADNTAALFDLTDSGDEGSIVDVPVTLSTKEVAYEYHNTLDDGTQVDDLDVYWVHGPLVLNAEMVASTGGLDTGTLATFMQKLDTLAQSSGGTTPPGTPVSPRAGAAGATSIRLDWIDPDAVADGYAVYSTDGGQVVGSAGPNAITYTVTNLQPGATYCFQVYAYNAAGTSQLSAQACATTAGQ